jgi:hypothetical protein
MLKLWFTEHWWLGFPLLLVVILHEMFGKRSMFEPASCFKAVIGCPVVAYLIAHFIYQEPMPLWAWFVFGGIPAVFGIIGLLEGR